MPRRSESIRPIAMWLLLTACQVGTAEEPRAHFSLDKGWVEVTLRQDGKPVAGAHVRIIDDKGANFGNGETAESGQTTFPLPRGASCIVEIQSGKQTADPIRLFKSGPRIEPARVLLSYGLRPCCRSKDPKKVAVATMPTEPEPLAAAKEAPRWWPPLIALGAGVVLTATFFLARHQIPVAWAPTSAIALTFAAVATFYLYQRESTNPTKLPHPDLAQDARRDLEGRDFRPLSESLKGLLSDSNFEPTPTQAHTLLLQQAPDFNLRDVDGTTWSLAATCRDGPVVLVFYYGYHCNHCVSQLFALDKDIDKFRELGAAVVAVSADPPEVTQSRFKQYGRFAFPVLSDPDNKVAEQFETFVRSAKTDEEGDLLHGTFLIDRDGKLIWSNCGDSPFIDNRSLLYHLAAMQSRLPTNVPSR